MTQPNKKKPHPWRVWNPDALVPKPREIYYDNHKFPKGLTKTNRAR